MIASDTGLANVFCLRAHPRRELKFACSSEIRAVVPAVLARAARNMRVRVIGEPNPGMVPERALSSISRKRRGRFGKARRCGPRPHRFRHRRLRLMPCGTGAAGSAPPWRWLGARIDVRHVSSAEHLAGSRFRDWPLADDRPRQCADERRLSIGPALLPGIALCRLRPHDHRRRARPDGRSAHPSAGEGQTAAA